MWTALALDSPQSSLNLKFLFSKSYWITMFDDQIQMIPYKSNEFTICPPHFSEKKHQQLLDSSRQEEGRRPLPSKGMVRHQGPKCLGFKRMLTR
jgi:hypothetical protein